jgi:hypothetical protein
MMRARKIAQGGAKLNSFLSVYIYAHKCTHYRVRTCLCPMYDVFVTIFLFFYPENIVDDLITGKQVYLEACRMLGRLTPISHLLDNIERDYVTLRFHNVGEKDGVALAECLKANACIKTLDITGNFLMEAGGVAVANALAVNRSLTSLNISQNRLGSGVGQAFAAMAQTNECLKELSLAGNKLDVHFADSFCPAMEEGNAVMRRIDLGSNDFGAAAAARIARCGGPAAPRVYFRAMTSHIYISC